MTTSAKRLAIGIEMNETLEKTRVYLGSTNHRMAGFSFFSGLKFNLYCCIVLRVKPSEQQMINSHARMSKRLREPMLRCLHFLRLLVCLTLHMLLSWTPGGDSVTVTSSPEHDSLMLIPSFSPTQVAIILLVHNNQVTFKLMAFWGL
ncbi:hypothetical protein GBAR_LOCUS12582 [Geodia barretti]|uniref:Uncharacterized protein n=1 Tax=Geodia barretti TaxID=519541 RepID=A0AA35S0F2_GEOBA|nr:hypothetical protein GBAR_LOCUS12582 [Geodia barretti]